MLRRVDRIYFHPQWIDGSSQNLDQLAILRVAEKFNFAESSSIVPICPAPNRNDEYPTDGSELAVIGWGTRQVTPPAITETIHQA